jgi:hypothetical protein
MASASSKSAREESGGPVKARSFPSLPSEMRVGMVSSPPPKSRADPFSPRRSTLEGAREEREAAISRMRRLSREIDRDLFLNEEAEYRAVRAETPAAHTVAEGIKGKAWSRLQGTLLVWQTAVRDARRAGDKVRKLRIRKR